MNNPKQKATGLLQKSQQKKAFLFLYSHKIERNLVQDWPRLERELPAQLITEAMVRESTGSLRSFLETTRTQGMVVLGTTTCKDS